MKGYLKLLPKFLPLIVFIILLSGMFFWFEKTLKTPNSQVAESKAFSITAGEGVWSISKNLKEEGLIKDEKSFVLYLRIKNKTKKLQAGEYRIPQNLTMVEVAEMITRGKTTTSKITIPEGWDNERIAGYLSDKGIVSKEEFLAEVKNSGKYDYWFLKDLPQGATLEGFLYPDTYVLSSRPTKEEIVEKMLENFNKKYTAELRDKTGKTRYNAYQIVTFASVVEREVSKPEDRRKVAGVFWNRLDIGMAMESDATVQYILKSNKRTFTYDEIEVDSPYNTYQNKGLPVGPIGNPSIDSIKAVLDPEESNYMFFLSAEGITYFSRTLAEHESKKQRYLK